MKKHAWTLGILAALTVLPFIPLTFAAQLGGQVKSIFIYCILALGLNVVVGYSGLLQLGIAAFFGLGAFATGILTVEQFPFQLGFWPAMVLATITAGVAGLLLAAPTLRMRGDYLAIVTLGFGEIVKFSITNLNHITGGTQALNPITPPWLPVVGSSDWWTRDYRGFYFVSMVILIAIVILLRNLERSRLGRAWMAIREDELAATCMGIDAARVKLSAFALGAALAGLAGALYATSSNQTGSPADFSFNKSITVLCFLIIGGLGSIRGALLGTFVLMGYDNILTPEVDGWLQQQGAKFKFSDIKLIVFGLALIAMMRFRPEGFLPSRRIKEELHHEDVDPETNRVGVE